MFRLFSAITVRSLVLAVVVRGLNRGLQFVDFEQAAR
jgi:hypothetical protein